MACLICDRSADYDLVRDGEAEAEVCRPCTEEFLAVDEGDPTCVYCDRNGVYDVRTHSDGGFPDAENTGDTFATPYESVLCEEHFEKLGDEEPAGSPEAADEADVEGDADVAEAEAEAEAEVETGAEAEPVDADAEESETGTAETAETKTETAADDESGDTHDDT